MNAIPYPTNRILIVLFVLFAIIAISCAPAGPPKPQPGTPAFQFLSAKEASRAGDFVKTNDLLAPLALGGTEYARPARPWALMTSLGMAKAYLEMADKLETGAKKSRDTAPFRRVSIGYRAKAQAAAMQYLEMARVFIDTNRNQEVSLQFEVPEAQLADPPEYQKITSGRLLPPAELAAVEKYVIQHEVLQNVCRALGAPQDPGKAKAAYVNGEAKAPGTQFLVSVAQGLYEVGEMFGPKKLDQPPRILSAVYSEALEALDLVKEDRQAQALAKKVAEAKKKLRLT